jgi:hypothetical protein
MERLDLKAPFSPESLYTALIPSLRGVNVQIHSRPLAGKQFRWVVGFLFVRCTVFAADCPGPDRVIL